MVVWGSRSSLWFSTCRFSWCIFFISQCTWCTEASCCRLASILPWFLASQVCRKWHGDEFCLQNPEVLSTKSSYSFKIHPDLRISLLVIQTKFHISSQEFQGNVSVVGGEVHKFHHLVNRKKIHKKPVPRLNHCHFLDEPFHNNYRSYLTLCIKNNMTNYVDVVPNTLATNIISEAYPPFFPLGWWKDGSTKSGRKSYRGFNRHGISWFPHSSGKCWDRKTKN